LEPEENTTIEGGFEYNSNKGLRLSGVYFNRNEQNTIVFTTAYENAQDDATVQGVELEAEWNILKNLSLSANYTFTEVRDGLRLRVPKHKANLNLSYSFSNTTNANLQYQYVGERPGTDFATFSPVTLNAFSLVNLQFSHKILSDKLKLFINLDNVFNEDYQEILEYSTLGRNVSLGFNLNL
jgi:vitamin B12 transporter